MSEQLELELDFGGPKLRPGARLVRNPQLKVREFHEATGAAVDQRTNEVLALRAKLIHEEFGELFDELVESWDVTGEEYKLKDISDIDLGKIAKEGADLMYVVLGTFVSLGIDGMRAFDQVHASNMSKLDDGKALLREDGKVLKGPNYFEPDMSGTYRED